MDSKPPWMLSCTFCTVLLSACLCSSCPLSNVSDEVLLGRNAPLRKIFNEYAKEEVLHADGLRELVSKLLPYAFSHHSDHHEDDHVSHDHRPKDESGHDNLVESEGGGHDPRHNQDHVHDLKELNSTLAMDVERFTPTSTKSWKELESKNSPVATQESTGSFKEDISPSHAADECNLFDLVISEGGFSKGDSLTAFKFLRLCPSIVWTLLNSPCKHHSFNDDDDDDAEHLPHEVDGHERRIHGHREHDRHLTETRSSSMTRDSWIGAILCMVLIGLTAIACIMVIPVIKKNRHYNTINQFLLALAVGSLAGDALIHLLPHAFTMKTSSTYDQHLLHSLYGLTAFVGIILFLFMERIHNLIGNKQPNSNPIESLEGDELIKEVGAISAELNDNGLQQQPSDKIGEKLSQHSKRSSFIYVDPTTPSESRGCFDSCPQALKSAIEDANGNSGVDSMICKSRTVDENSASVAECERLVNASSEKTEQNTSKKTLPIPPPPLVQSTPPKRVVRQDSKNFNMVLQEYHVGHHGHSHHGHSHLTGKKESLRTMILLGDGMHSFMDGMAIGAAFGTSLTGGISTAIAVLCHELPHKVGDFAILFEMGMNRTQALKMFVMLWILSIGGLAVGISIGSIHAVAPWIYCFTAGVFLYLALVDLLSELPVNRGETCNASGQMLVQGFGMLAGAAIMLVIAIYEHDLKNSLEGSF